MPEASGEPLRPGERLGHYQVRRLIAAGGMAEIYEAFSAALNQRVAIKVLRPGLRQHGEAAARFANEARAINLVRHSGEARRCVPTIHDMGTMKEGASYLVMEYLEGESLRARLPHTHVGPRELSWLRQLTEVLCAVHTAGVVHRDLKPDNVMLVPDPEAPLGERVVLIDFGVAKLPDPMELPMGHTLVRTGLGKYIGSAHYAAPEQRGTADSVDGKADVYALGVMLYEMLAGRPPFSGDTDAELMMQHIHEPVPPLRRTVPGAPRPLKALALQMLAKQPGARPQMAEVAARLRHLGGSRAASRWLALGGLGAAGAAVVFLLMKWASPGTTAVAMSAADLGAARAGVVAAGAVDGGTAPGHPPTVRSTNVALRPSLGAVSKRGNQPPLRTAAAQPGRKKKSEVRQAPPSRKEPLPPPAEEPLLVRFLLESPSSVTVSCGGKQVCRNLGPCQVHVPSGATCTASGKRPYEPKVYHYDELEKKAPGPITINLLPRTDDIHVHSE